MDLKEPFLVQVEDSKKPNQGQFKSHNIFFTRISKFIKLVRSLNKDELLQNEQTHPYIASDTSVENQITKLEKYLSQNQHHFQPTNFNLLKVYIYMTGVTFLKGFAITMLYEALEASGIYMLDYATDRLKEFNGDTNDKVAIAIILLAIVANYTFRNFVFVQLEWIKFKWESQCKTTLQYLVYKKSLKVKYYCKKSNLVAQQMEEKKKEEEGEKDGDDEEPITFEKSNPDINNLLTVDVDESREMYWGINQLCASAVVLAITLVFLYHKIGSSILNGIYMLAGALAFCIIVGYLMNICYDKIYACKDDRISISKDVIEGMKSIKYLCWEKIFSKKIIEIRKREFKFIFGMRALDGFLTLFFMSLTYLLLYAFIVSYVNDGNNLSDSNVFTIIALFGNLAYPLGMIPFAAKCVTKARISFLRIKSFLNLNEIVESDVITNQDHELMNNGQNQDNQQEHMIAIKQLNFNWPNKEIKQELNDNIRNLDQPEAEERKLESEQFLQNQNDQDQLMLTDSTQFQLQVDDLQISMGSLNVIIGQIGSGKTALLLSILNEMEKKQQNQDPSLLSSNPSHLMKMTNFENKIVVNGSMSYVSQNHWLQTKTIRDNILFGLPYDEVFYNKCIELCSLKIDLSHFYKGDKKIISSDGNNLSGGQRQRISLCRALYQNKDIYLLDDIFSSLDAHVAEFIFHHAIVEYLIQQKKKTVLLVTSHYGFLTDRSINQIIYIKNGKIILNKSTIESYINDSQQKEIEKKNDFFIEEENDEGEQNDIDFPNSLAIEKEEVHNRLQLVKQPSEKQQNQLQLQKIPSKNLVYKDKDEDQEEGQGENEEFREKGQIKLATLKTYFKSQNYVVLFFLIFFFAVGEFVTILVDFWLKDQLTYEDASDSAFNFINKLFSGFSQTFLFLTMMQLLMTSLSSLFYVIASLLSCYRIFHRLNDAIMQSKMVFFDKNPVGRIINRLSDDVNSIDDDLPLFMEITLELMAQALGYPIGISIQFPWMSGFFVLSFIISYYISKMYRDANREVKRLNSVNKGQLLSHISESCKGIITVRSMGKQVYMTKLYIERLTNSINSFLLSLSMEMWMYVRLLLISNLIQLLIVITVIILICIDSDMNKNVILLCLSYGILFIGSICDVVNFICLTEQEMISVERVRQYFENEQEITDNKSKSLKRLSNDYEQNKINNISEEYSVVFKNLFITYDEVNQENVDSVQYALKNFDLQIKRGEKIAFCGRTGSGKTSILNCLYRMYEYQKGQIFINSTDIQDMSLHELRSKMAIIPQFGFLYNATLRDNIDPLEEYSDEQIKNLITSTSNESQDQISSDCFKDLDFEIQEGGKNLSNGQKQIINFIRVALRDTEIICLDEATSNMDPKTDELIHQKLFELSEGKTLLVITHRLENIQKFDRIVVLDYGHIVECGNYEELKQIQGGFFNKLIQKENNKSQ